VIVVSEFSQPIFAWLTTFWYLLVFPGFFFTYNHIGGILALLLTVYFLVLYIFHKKEKHLYCSLLAIFFLLLIKINFGLSALISTIISVYIANALDKKDRNLNSLKFLSISLLLVPTMVFLVYFFLLKDLSFYAIRQCMPYLSTDHPYSISLVSAFFAFVQFVYTQCFAFIENILLLILFVASLIRIYFSEKKQIKKNDPALITILALLVFYITSLHEFFASGVIYRLTWSYSFALLMLFSVFAFALRNIKIKIKHLIYGMVIFALFITARTKIKNFNHAKAKGRYVYITNPRLKIVSGNPISWIKTVFFAKDFINNNIPKDELFFAMPYDPIYYYLTDRDSPTRQLIFFKHINIPQEQEEKILSELIKKDVKWILLSNRIRSNEHGLGVFGKDYCRIMDKYFKENFETIAKFGEWQKEPGWAWNYGVMILKKKE